MAASLAPPASYFPPHFLFPPSGLLPRRRAIGAISRTRLRPPPGLAPRAPGLPGRASGRCRVGPARREEEPRSGERASRSPAPGTSVQPRTGDSRARRESARRPAGSPLSPPPRGPRRPPSAGTERNRKEPRSVSEVHVQGAGRAGSDSHRSEQGPGSRADSVLSLGCDECPAQHLPRSWRSVHVCRMDGGRK